MIAKVAASEVAKASSAARSEQSAIRVMAAAKVTVTRQVISRAPAGRLSAPHTVTAEQMPMQAL